MSYEGKMLDELNMPSRKEVEKALLKSLFKHNGVIKEFSGGEEIVEEIANYFGLNDEQRNAYLETIYHKENRVKRSSLWHRLLFRAADSLAKEKLVSRPTQTMHLTNRKEWMLTENGFDKALIILEIPKNKKDFLPTKSYEVQKIVKKLKETPRPENYNPFDKEKKVVKVTKEMTLRERGFRQAVIEAYGYKCAVCGMKLNSPDSLLWEVQAAHIVPHSSNGKDDIWNGLSLCRLHHWAFDVGWFTLLDDYKIQVSKQADKLPLDFGKFGEYELIKIMMNSNSRIYLPGREEIYPHTTAIRWHRENIFFH
jgi:hypothetical protein